MKGWKTFALYAAVLGAAAGANLLGIVPKPTPGWLFLSGTLLVMLGGGLLDKARKTWTDTGSAAAALEDIVMATALINGGLGCILVGFFSGAAS